MLKRGPDPALWSSLTRVYLKLILTFQNVGNKLEPLILTGTTMSLMVFDIENVTSIISIVWPDNEWDFVRNNL